MRWIVGLLLIVAALLKSIEIYQHPSSILADDFSRFLTPVLIGCELGLGLCAILRLYWRQLRLLAMLLFASFACYSLLLVFQGAVSCGCFGQLKVNPWWTLLLDIAIFAGLALEFFAKKTDETSRDKPKTIHAIGTGIISFALALGLMWHAAPRQASSQNEFLTIGNLIILEPETWAGKKFPLLEYVDVDVSQGKWVLLLHRHDCSKCLEAVPKYDKLASLSLRYQVAIIEVPPHDASHETNASHCHVGQLSDAREWFVETPVEIDLENGVVMKASTGLPSLHK